MSDFGQQLEIERARQQGAAIWIRLCVALLTLLAGSLGYNVHSARSADSYDADRKMIANAIQADSTAIEALKSRMGKDEEQVRVDELKQQQQEDHIDSLDSTIQDMKRLAARPH